MRRARPDDEEDIDPALYPAIKDYKDYAFELIKARDATKKEDSNFTAYWNAAPKEEQIFQRKMNDHLQSIRVKRIREIEEDFEQKYGMSPQTFMIGNEDRYGLTDFFSRFGGYNDARYVRW